MRGNIVRQVLVALRIGRSGTQLLMHWVALVQDADRSRSEPGIGAFAVGAEPEVFGELRGHRGRNKCTL